MQSTEIGSDSDKDTLVYNDYTLKGNWKCIFNAAKALHRTLCSSSLDFFQVPPTPWSIADDRYSWARPSLRTIESYCFLFWPKPAPTICFQSNFLSHRYSINKWSPLPPQEWRLEVINRILTTGSQVSFWAFWGMGERIEMVYFQAILKRLGIFFFWIGFLVHIFCWRMLETREVCTYTSTHISWSNFAGKECYSQCSRLPWSGSGCSALCLGWASATTWFLSETQLERESEQEGEISGYPPQDKHTKWW